MSKDKILIIYTGGTIGGERNANDYITEDLKPKLFTNIIYELFPSIKNEIELDISTPVKKFSEEFVPADWIRIADDIKEKLSQSDYSGVVIAHGTDTMSYTAAALSYIDFGKNLPICLTGSNYPIKDKKSDAPKNFHDAIFVARQKNLNGTYVVFAGNENEKSHIHIGTRVRKVKFVDNCFKSINAPEVGVVEKGIIFSNTNIRFNNEFINLNINFNKNNKLLPKIDPKVCFFKIYPGFNPNDIIYKINNSQASGIILELYNSGTGCTTDSKYSLKEALYLAKTKNIPVFATSQHEGSVEMNSYRTSIELREAGVIPLKDMISEAAITKLMIVLGQKSNYDDVINVMVNNIAGEISS